MKKVNIEDIDPVAPPDENIPNKAMANSVGDARPLSEPLDTTGLSINYYELAPGESFTVSFHRHSTQEELFYIQSGTAIFETENGDVEVNAGEIIRFPPETFQLGTNYGDERVTAITLGAPREYQAETEWLVDCNECGERAVHIFQEAEEEDEFVYYCAECDTETHRVSQ